MGWRLLASIGSLKPVAGNSHAACVIVLGAVGESQARAWTRRTAVARSVLAADAPSFAREQLMRLSSSARCTGRATLAHHATRCSPSEGPRRHDERSPRLDDYVVLSGGLEVGGYHRSGSGPSEGRWSWAYAIGTDDTTFAAGGYAAYPEVCRTLITLAFRQTLARADLRATGREAGIAAPRCPARRGIAEHIVATAGL